MPPAFSDTWYAVFAESIPEERTRAEVAFLRRHLPQPDYRHVLDVCCGRGRHAVPLAASGYEVTGIDTNAAALAWARQRVPSSVSLIAMDMRDLNALDSSFDGAINLWQSFGYFDDTENLRALGLIADRLRPGGRFIVDLYNRDAARALPPEEETVREAVHIRTKRTWRGSRLRVELWYAEGPAADTFEWRVYSTDEWEAIAREAGFRTVLRCAWFDERTPPSPDHLRTQFVLQKHP